MTVADDRRGSTSPASTSPTSPRGSPTTSTAPWRRSASTSSPAATPTSRTGSPAPTARAFVLRRPPLGHVLASAHDMGREHRIIAGLQDSRGARRRRRSGYCDDAVGQRRAVLRDGLRRRPRLRDRPSPRPRSTRRRPGQRQPVDRRHDGRDPRRRPRRRRARRPRPPRGLHRPPAQAVVRPVEPAEDPRAAARRRGPRRARRAHPRAGPGDDRPRRLPPRQLHRRRRRRRRRRARLGDLHARRPARRPRAAAGVLDRARRRGHARGPARSTTAPGFWDRAELAERYAEVSGPRPRRSSTSTSRSAYWKLACILEGVYARYLGGALGERDRRRARTVQAAGRGGRASQAARSTWSGCR